MQRIASTLLGLSLFFLVIFTTGCGDDTPGGGGTVDLPPTISLAGDAGFVSFDQSVALALPTFSVRVVLDDGDNPLSSFTIAQDGITMPTGNLVFDAGATTSQNPFGIFGADQSGTTYDIDITPVAPVANTASVFTFTVTDSERLTAVTNLNITFNSTPATLTFGAGGVNVDSEISTITPAFNVDVMATRGDADITSISFFENGILMDASEVRVAGSADPISANPLSISPFNDLYNVVFTINPNDAADGLRNYTVEVTDALGVTASQTIGITYFTPEVGLTTNVLLLNQGGAAGTGGLDLDATENGGTGSNSEDAEIQDEGIDLDVAGPNNWRRQISAANNAVLRIVDVTTLPEGNFDNVTTLAQVRDAFLNGAIPAGSDTNCNCTDSVNGEEVTAPLVGGEVLAIERDGNYYLVRVDQVNNTDSGNTDEYMLSIKK